MPPSVLCGVIARFKLSGEYRLRPVAGVEAAAAGGGAPPVMLLQVGAAVSRGFALLLPPCKPISAYTVVAPACAGP